jgi:hypothetical protein
MNYRKTIWVFAWFLAALGAVDIGFELITMPNTFLNIVGLSLVFGYGLVSIKTRCFTKFKTNKDEKN